MKPSVILIDGGHLRALARDAGLDPTPDFIERVSRQCRAQDEELIRVLYYDCRPYIGRQRLPISGQPTEFNAGSAWLDQLASLDIFAVRLGQLKFRGWSPRRIPVQVHQLSDSDFKPNFEQKGVDMRLGLDIARLAEERIVNRVILVSADTDMIPAMKQARRVGIQVVIVQLPTQDPRSRLRDELKHHADYVRTIAWPPMSSRSATS